MCKVILDYKKCSKFFNVYSYHSKEFIVYYITSLNKDCVEYLKYISCYSEINPPHSILYEIKYPNEKNNSWITEHFYEHEILEFEFPDEETAFYFKLKYC